MVGEDLLPGAVSDTVQAARQGHGLMRVGLADLGVVVGDAQAVGCLLQDHRLQGVAPAHGLVADVRALLAVDSVDAELQLVIGGAVPREAHQPREAGCAH